MSHYRGATADSIKGRAMLAAVESSQGPKGEGPCAWPGCRSAWEQVDHIVPRALGGGDEPENLQGLCQAHNAAKGDGRPYRWVGPMPAPAAAAGTTSREWLS
jgi:5-methylcytosine-specific restriction endonuclease McrA